MSALDKLPVRIFNIENKQAENESIAALFEQYTKITEGDNYKTFKENIDKINFNDFVFQLGEHQFLGPYFARFIKSFFYLSACKKITQHLHSNIANINTKCNDYKTQFTEITCNINYTKTKINSNLQKLNATIDIIQKFNKDKVKELFITNYTINEGLYTNLKKYMDLMTADIPDINVWNGLFKTNSASATGCTDNFIEPFIQKINEINKTPIISKSIVQPILDIKYQVPYTIQSNIDSARPVNKGIKSETNMCYFNSSIQMLNDIDEFRKYILSYAGEDEKIKILKILFDKLNDTTVGPVQINDITKKLGGDASSFVGQIANFVGHKKEDADDLIIKIFEYLAKTDNNNYNTFVSNINFYEEQFQKCDKEMDYNIINIVPNQIWKMPLPATNSNKTGISELKTIQDLITDYQKEEDIMNPKTGNIEKEVIESCETNNLGLHAKIRYEIKVNQENKWLIIALKRFHREPGYSRKINTPVNIEYEIEIQKEGGGEAKYNPVGVILHSGNLDNGHYRYATLKKNGTESVSTDIIYNDGTVSQINERNLEELCYVILYKRNDTKSLMSSSISEPKLNETRNITLIGVHYDIKDHYTDTATNDSQYLLNENTLIIYNENFQQYYQKDCSAGGGNGNLRQYRSDSEDCKTNRTNVKAFVYGIPTGINNTNEFNLNDESIYDNKSYRLIIDESIKAIIDCINKNKTIKYVFWSVEKRDEKQTEQLLPKEGDSDVDLDARVFKIGLDIFKKIDGSIQATDYISRKLFEIFKSRKYYFSDNDSTVKIYGKNKSNLQHKKIKNMENFYLSNTDMQQIIDTK